MSAITESALRGTAPDVLAGATETMLVGNPRRYFQDRRDVRKPGCPGGALSAAAGTPGSGDQRMARISLVLVVDRGDHASG